MSLIKSLLETLPFGRKAANQKSPAIYYFIGTAAHHLIHAYPLIEVLPGLCIVLCQEAREWCERKNIPCLLLDDYGSNTEQFDFRKIRRTLRYLNDQRGVIFFFQTFNVVSQIRNLTKVMLFHGNSLKDFWFTDRKIPVLNQFDHIMGVGPHRESVMLKRGVEARRIVRLGLNREDQILKPLRADKNQIWERLGGTPRPIITYAPTWWPPYSVEDLGLEIVDQISDDTVLVFRPHPDTPAALIERYQQRIARRQNVLYAPEHRFPGLDLVELIHLSDLFIVDMSSVAIDAVLSDKPLIFAFGEHKNPELYHPSYAPTLERMSPIQELYESSPQLNMSNVGDLNQMLTTALETPLHQEARKLAKQRLFYNLDGSNTERLVEWALGLLAKSSGSALAVPISTP